MLTPELWRQVEDVFARARDLPEPLRSRFVRESPGIDDAVRREVESLLASQADDFLEPPSAASEPASLALPLPSALGQFRVERVLGRGGMGIVYQGHDTRLDRPVALKLLSADLASDAEHLSRLEREARALARINHENVAAIHGLEKTDDDQHYLVLELVEGLTLADRLRRGRLPLREALDVAHQVARALAAAHGRGVIHRDLKPANVLINPEGIVKVVDFGLAKQVPKQAGDECVNRTGPRTLAGLAVGTPGYMSPEQLRGTSVDARADLFALGCLLHECLAGFSTFGGATTLDVIASTLTREPDWSGLPDDTPRKVQQLLRDCLEKDVERRLGEAAAAALVLAGALRGDSESPAVQSPEVQQDLPAPLSTLVGRVRELDETAALLSEARLLTLTGPGGCGKTTLALALARRTLRHHGAGTWLVELAGVSDRRQVAAAILAAVDPGAAHRGVPARDVAELIAGKRALLLLDNCEHLAGECSEIVARLLRRCPDLRVLATSRSNLSLPGEVTYVVPPLAVPAGQDAATVQDLSTNEAVMLFVERARAARPEFRLDEENAAAVAQTCRQLDGMPLAIELAAARVRALSPESIARRLETSTALLAARGPIAEPRQQTMRAAFDWSFQLLGDDEQTLLRRLSVFAGGCTLEAAEAVGADGSQLRVEEVLDLLTSLVEKSLVSFHETKAGARYRLLETTRQSALEELEATGDGPTTRERHAEYFLQWSEALAPRLSGDAREAFDELRLDHDNVLAALDWLTRTRPGTGQALRLAVAAWPYWDGHALYAFARDTLTAEMERDAAAATPGLECVALHATGLMAHRLDRNDEARTCLDRALELAREIGDEDLVAMASGSLGLVAAREGRHGDARQLHEAALAAHRAAGRHHAASLELARLGTLAVGRGDYAAALRFYEEPVAMIRRRHATHGNSVALANYSFILWHVGEYERGMEHGEEALASARDEGNPHELARARVNIARCLGFLGRLDEAAAQLRESVESLRVQGLRYHATYAWNFLAWVLLERAGDGDLLEARECAEEARDAARAIGLVHGEVYALSLGARVAAARGDVAAAVELSSAAVRLLESHEHVEVKKEEIYFNHHRTLLLANRPDEALAALVTAERALLAKAALFADPAQRDTFLERVELNVGILAAVREAGR